MGGRREAAGTSEAAGSAAGTSEAAGSAAGTSEAAGSAAGHGAGAAALAEVRHTLRELHAQLASCGLVAWTSGNISARVPGTDLMVIKPSGLGYAELAAESMVVCDLDGHALDDPAVNPAGYRPSSDTLTHAYVYRQMSGVGGVVHTHSAYATAWAARGESVPCVITAMADEFGGEIPVGPFALIGGDEIGRSVVATLSGHRSPAVLAGRSE